MRQYKLHDKLLWTVDEFDGHSETICSIVEIAGDHAIAFTDDELTLWIDDDTEYMYQPLYYLSELNDFDSFRNAVENFKSEFAPYEEDMATSDMEVIYSINQNACVFTTDGTLKGTF